MVRSDGWTEHHGLMALSKPNGDKASLFIRLCCLIERSFKISRSIKISKPSKKNVSVLAKASVWI